MTRYKLALLGRPVAHSRSPAIFQAAFAAAGLEGTYEARSVDEAGVHQAFAQLRAKELDGLNVTMPHKRLASSLCDEIEGKARRAGSVNTVISSQGRAIGYSTDIDAIGERWSAFPAESPVLILGSGGAAAAALVALEGRNPYLAARRFGVGTELGKRVGVEVGEVRFGVPVIGAIVVNCTPLGMHGEELPKAVLELAGGLFDMPYGPRPTPAVAFMRQQHLPVVEGIDLLVTQAAFGFRLFTGMAAPLEAMGAAAENH